jgi:hypothetical protein
MIVPGGWRSSRVAGLQKDSFRPDAGMNSKASLIGVTG